MAGPSLIVMQHSHIPLPVLSFVQYSVLFFLFKLLLRITLGGVEKNKRMLLSNQVRDLLSTCTNRITMNMHLSTLDAILAWLEASLAVLSHLCSDKYWKREAQMYATVGKEIKKHYGISIDICYLRWFYTMQRNKKQKAEVISWQLSDLEDLDDLLNRMEARLTIWSQMGCDLEDPKYWEREAKSYASGVLSFRSDVPYDMPFAEAQEILVENVRRREKNFLSINFHSQAIEKSETELLTILRCRKDQATRALQEFHARQQEIYAQQQKVIKKEVRAFKESLFSSPTNNTVPIFIKFRRCYRIGLTIEYNFIEGNYSSTLSQFFKLLSYFLAPS